MTVLGMVAPASEPSGSSASHTGRSRIADRTARSRRGVGSGIGSPYGSVDRRRYSSGLSCSSTSPNEARIRSSAAATVGWPAAVRSGDGSMRVSDRTASGRADAASITAAAP